jgi:transporter family-2 protein
VSALGYALFAFAAGCMLSLQAGVNTQLAEWMGGPVRGALVSFAVGTIVLLAIAAAFFHDRSVENLRNAPWWIWVGGLLGAFFVVATIVTAPELGAAAMVVILVAGQSVAALVLDHYGWVGFPVHHVTPGRILGVVLLAGGVALVRFA